MNEQVKDCLPKFHFVYPIIFYNLYSSSKLYAAVKNLTAAYFYLLI